MSGIDDQNSTLHGGNEKAAEARNIRILATECLELMIKTRHCMAEMKRLLKHETFELFPFLSSASHKQSQCISKESTNNDRHEDLA